MSWLSVGIFRVSFNPASRGEVLGSSIANIDFLRADIVHVSCGLSALTVNGHDARRHRIRASFFQQILDPSFRLIVVTLAEVFVANLASGVDEVVRGPVLIVKRVPYLIVTVESHRIGDAEFLHGLFDVRRLLFDIEFGGVDSDDYKTAVPVFVCRARMYGMARMQLMQE